MKKSQITMFPRTRRKSRLDKNQNLFVRRSTTTSLTPGHSPRLRYLSLAGNIGADEGFPLFISKKDFKPSSVNSFPLRKCKCFSLESD